MQATPQATIYRPETAVVVETPDAPAASATSWGAIIAGAFAAAAIGLILIALGAGFGFSAVSPWSHSGASATAVTVGGAIWLLVTSAIASAIGGYLAGRLRTRWTDVHGDEVYFRDTAHGFIAWAVGTVVTAAVLTSAASALVGGAARLATSGAAATVAGAAGAAPAADASTMPADFSAYYADGLFRTDHPADTAAPADGAANGSAAAPATGASRAEVARIFANGLKNGDLPPSDRLYLTRVVVARTGMSPADADKRVNDAFANAKAVAADAENKARAAADTARKAAATTSLWTFIALLLGAFAASYAATFGGRLRDGLRT